MLIEVKQIYNPADVETKVYLETQRTQFIDANKHRDTRYNVNEELIVPHTVTRLAMVPNDRELPFWFSLRGYALSVVLGLSFVYCMLVEVYVYDRATWVCDKVVSSRPMGPSGPQDVQVAESVV
jgi:hypothetical protein